MSVFSYEVQTLLSGGTWENVWKDGQDQPIIFETKREAFVAIVVHLNDCADAYMAGHLAEPENIHNYRIKRRL